MFKARQTIFIPRNKRDVYEAAEKYPYFVKFFLNGSRIIRENEKSTAVLVHAKLMGFLKTKWLGRGRKKKFESIRFTQTKGLFKGLRAFWLFREVDDGTVVSIRTSFSKPRIGLAGEWMLGRFVVENTTKKLLNELKFHFNRSEVNKAAHNQ